MKRKTVLCLIISMILCGVSLFPVFAATEETSNIVTGACGENVNYELNLSTGILSIFGTGAMYDYMNPDAEEKIKAPWIEAGYGSDIKKVVIEEGITHVGAYAFCTYRFKDGDCPNITEVEIAGTVTGIGEYAFANCEGISFIDIPDDLTNISEGVFSGTSISDISWGNSLEYIGDSAFAGTGVASIQIPDRIKSIGIWAFSGCKSLKSVIVPDGCEVHYEAFSYTPLETISFGKNCKLHGKLFWKCPSLKEINIGEGCISAKLDYHDDDYGTFEGCSGVQTISLPDSWLFEGDADSAAYTRQFAGCTKLEEIEISDTNTRYKVIDKVVYSKDEKTLVYYPPALPAKEYEIKAGTTSIAISAFDEQNYLENIVIPSTVQTIGARAFQLCSKLNNVIIPEGIKELGGRGFANCDNLKVIALPGSIENIDINGKASTATFDGTDLEIVYGEENSYVEEWAGEKFQEIVYCEFDANGGMVEEERKVIIPGDMYRQLPTPIKEGYQFTGWYTKIDLGEIVTKNTMVLEEISHTLYAHWQAIPSAETPTELPEVSPKPIFSDSSIPISTEVSIFTNSPVASPSTKQEQIISIPGNIKKYTKNWSSKKFNLNAESSGDGELIYHSGNTKIVRTFADGSVKMTGYGKTIITITASETDKYRSSTKRIIINVLPKKAEIKKVVSPSKGKIQCSWKKDKMASGYQVQISCGSNKHIINVKKNAVQGKVDSGKKYTVKVRSYKKAGKKKYYGSWSNDVKVKVK